MEPVIAGVFEEFGDGKSVTKNWPRIPYAEAIRKYGSDKPDLRNPLEMQDVSEHFRGSGFKVFARILEDDEEPGLGDSRRRAAAARLLRPDELLGAGRRPARPRLHHVARGRGRRPDRQQHRPGAGRGDPRRSSA